MRRTFLIVLLMVCGSRSEAQYSGGTGTADDPYLIGTAQEIAELAADANDWSLCFRQIAPIDMAELTGGAPPCIGNQDIPFSGVFDGAGQTIANFATTGRGDNGIGLFGQVRGYTARVCNVTLVDPNIQAPDLEYVGALAGRLRSGSVTNCHVVGAHITGHMGVGGLIGWNQGAVSNCSTTGAITGVYSVGGLAGVTFWCDDIRDCRAHVTVCGVKRVGGLVGNCALAGVQWCSAGGSVTGQIDVGGLVGASDGGLLANCYAGASVTGTEAVGGLLGCNTLSCDCSAGALPGEVRCCYSTGPVQGTFSAGGLVGVNHESIVRDSFWDTQTSEMATSDGGVGLATAALQSEQTFAGAHWDFTPKTLSMDYWVMRGPATYPRPAWQIVPGDADDDGDVDLADFSLLARDWSQASSSFCEGGHDLTGDACVDIRDIAALSHQWLRGAGSP